MSKKRASTNLLIMLLCLLFSVTERAANGQSIYRAEPGFFLSLDLLESSKRQLSLTDGPGIGVEAGIRFRSMDLGVFLRRVGEKEFGDGHIRTGRTAFGPALGYTFRRPAYDAGAAFSVQGILVRDDKTMRDWPPGGTASYAAGPAISAQVIRARAVYFREVRYASGLALSPKIGVFYYARFFHREVSYSYASGVREERIYRIPAQHAPGVVLGMPITVEAFPGHRFTLEPVLEVRPADFRVVALDAAPGINVRVLYNF